MILSFMSLLNMIIDMRVSNEEKLSMPSSTHGGNSIQKIFQFTLLKKYYLNITPRVKICKMELKEPHQQMLGYQLKTYLPRENRQVVIMLLMKLLMMTRSSSLPWILLIYIQTLKQGKNRLS